MAAPVSEAHKPERRTSPPSQSATAQRQRASTAPRWARPPGSLQPTQQPSAANSLAQNAGDNRLGAGSQATGGNSTALGLNSAASADRRQPLVASSTASGIQSAALGAQSSATGLRSTALGAAAIASATNTTAVGTSASAVRRERDDGFWCIRERELHGAVAFGHGAQANRINSVAMGLGATTDGFSAVSIGVAADADGDSSVAVGRDANAIGIASVVLGPLSTANGSRDVIVGGNNVTSGGSRNTAIGSELVITGGGRTRHRRRSHRHRQQQFRRWRSQHRLWLRQDVVTGNDNQSPQQELRGRKRHVVTATESVVIGSNSTATAPGAISVGQKTTASANGALAIGADVDTNGAGATATGIGSLAIGDASAAGVQANAVGTGAAAAAGDGSVAAGNLALANVVALLSAATRPLPAPTVRRSDRLQAQHRPDRQPMLQRDGHAREPAGLRHRTEYLHYGRASPRRRAGADRLVRCSSYPPTRTATSQPTVAQLSFHLRSCRRYFGRHGEPSASALEQREVRPAQWAGQFQRDLPRRGCECHWRSLPRLPHRR